MKKNKKLLVILGPTASGKSSLAVLLAQKHNGEIISADSRQVYKGLDVATGKVTEKEMAGIPHHLLDVASPQDQFSVAEYKELADKAIENIHKKGKLPILTGGTGFYIQAIVDDVLLPEVAPNEKLRKSLENTPKEELLSQLTSLDPKRAETVDKENPRRLIRAIEIATEIGSVPETKTQERFDTFQTGLEVPEDILLENIIKRTRDRMENGMVEEALHLHKTGLSLERMKELGLEYARLADYIKGEITTAMAGQAKEKLEELIINNDRKYAKRQMRWFKRDPRIHWHVPSQKDEIFLDVQTWLDK